MPRFSSYQGTSANTRIPEALNPSYFRLDERSTTDLLNYIKRLAQHLRYYNAANQPEGDWSDFFLSDESFLLADIMAYNLNEIEDQRLTLMSAFDSFADNDQRLNVWSSFLDMLWSMLARVDSWYTRASVFNRQRESTPLESELSGAINSVLSTTLNKLLAFQRGAALSGHVTTLQPDPADFSAVWNAVDSPPDPPFEQGDDAESRMTNALKQLLLLYRTITKAIHGIQSKAPDLFRRSLEHNDAHEPHIGLLLAFLEQFKLVQDDMNALTGRHLHFFYRDLLGQVPSGMTPDQVHLIAMLTNNSGEVVIPAGLRATAGQDDRGENLLFEVRDTCRLSQVRVASVKTLFVSRNPLMDYFTRYRLVSGIYQDDPLLRASDDPQSAGWATLGEEQLFRTTQERTMQDASIGFAVSSSVLLLSSGERSVELIFRLQPASMEQLTMLVTDIANNRQLRPEEVVQEVFSSAFVLTLSAEDGWHRVGRYEVSLSDEMNNSVLGISFVLDPSAPPIVRHTPTIHGSELQATQPVLRAHLRTGVHFYGYSFLEPLLLEDISIRVAVSNVANLKMFNRFGPLDLNSPAEFLGPMPARGSYFLIGHEELFCKQLTDVAISWEYQPFPEDTRNLETYFGAYGQQINNDHYQLDISARTNYQFSPLTQAKRQQVGLFDLDAEGLIRRERSLTNIDVGLLDIHPDHYLKGSQLDNYSRDSRTGFFRFELSNPVMGFGFEAFPGVFAAAVTANAAQGSLLKGESPKVPLPKNPFAPAVDKVRVDYKAKDLLVFEESRLLENDPDSGSEFYLYHPFGVSQSLSGGKSHSRKILPAFAEEGYLHLGLEQVKPGQEVNLLFDLMPGTAWEMGVAPILHWEVLSGDVWKPLNDKHMLADETRGLMETGILRLKLPTDINTGHGSMPAQLFWLRASVEHKAEMISRTRNLYTNALTAVFTPAGDQHSNPLQLPAGRIRDFVEPVAGVVNVTQPLPSFGGRPSEQPADWLNRISERIRHKNRALTRWDIERLLLQRFEWLAQAKCVGPWGSDELVDSGAAVVVAMPHLTPGHAPYEPNLNQAEIGLLEDYLKTLSSPFARLTVRNPNYEYLRIKCKVNLAGTGQGILLEQLQEDLRSFISPWLFSGTVNASLGGAIQVTELLGFIQGRPYINYVTAFSVVHLQTDLDGRIIIRDSADSEQPYDTIRGGTPWSVFLLHKHNDLSVISDFTYQEPTVTALSDLRIGEDLVIASETGTEEGAAAKQDQSGGRGPADDDNSNPMQITIEF